MKLSYANMVFIFLILVCGFVIGLFVFNIFIGSMSLFENILGSSISLVGCFGLIAILKGFRKIGIVLVAFDLAVFIVQRIVFNKGIINTIYFWTFLVVLIYFISLELRARKRSK